MKGKHSTHLANVPEASNNSTSGEPDYYNKHGDPVYAHMVSIQDQNQKKKIDSVPNQYQFRESEGLGGKFQVSYCSTKGWHQSRYESHEF